jgi:serine/threonine protein phosphatase PrpC
VNAPAAGGDPPAGSPGGDPPGPAADLSACSSCGAGSGAIGGDGFCNRCGQQRVDASRNHLEIAVSPQLAGVTDIGLKHFRNEDALGLAEGPESAAMVVCDGVSHSQNPDLASARAAIAALDALRAAVANPSGNHAHDLVTVALQAAQTAVRSIPLVDSSQEDPPESTIIVALRRGRQVSLGWLGDSRAYLITPDDARQCTTDHSWLNEVVDSGKMTRAEALASPLAHALTRSLGGPAGSSDESSQLDFELPAGPSWLVLCSDGLWNHLPDAASLAVLIRSQAAEADALARARALVEFARQRGGHDNITAAVLRCQSSM